MRKDEVAEHIFVGHAFPMSGLVRDPRSYSLFRPAFGRHLCRTVVIERIARVVVKVVLRTVAPHRVRAGVQQARLNGWTVVQLRSVYRGLLNSIVCVIRA